MGGLRLSPNPPLYIRISLVGWVAILTNKI